MHVCMAVWLYACVPHEQEAQLLSDSGHGPEVWGWAEGWLQLSVMPNFPEMAGRQDRVALEAWFASPTVIIYNQVRSGATWGEGGGGAERAASLPVVWCGVGPSPCL